VCHALGLLQQSRGHFRTILSKVFYYYTPYCGEKVGSKFGLRSKRWRKSDGTTSLHKRNLLATIDQLTDENEILRDTVADVFEVLNEIEETAERDLMFTAIHSACHYIISDLPDEYEYADSANGNAQDASEGMAQDATEMQNVIVRRLRRRMAKELSVDPDAITGITDPNVVMTAFRRALLKEAGVQEVSDDPFVTEHDYVAAVAEQFLWLMFFSAIPPISYKREAQRYFEAVRRIKAAIPKRPRPVGPDVQKALEMLARGHTWPEIRDEMFGSLNIPERRQALTKLQSKIRALRAIRERRARDRNR
jgi:hypothetical protein